MIVIILFLAWTIFCLGFCWKYIQDSNRSHIALAVGLSPLFIGITVKLAWNRFIPWWTVIQSHLEKHTETIDALPQSNIGLWIALSAGLGLFLELMMIRLHSSYFTLFAYFKNVSLLSCFLGLGIGYANGSKKILTTPLAFPFLAAQILFMYSFRFIGLVVASLQNPISEQFAMGVNQASELSHIMTVYGFLSLIFAFNALCFIPLGQLAGHLMLRQNKLTAYSWNLVGSLGGVLLFSVLSFLWTPPVIWIFIASSITILFLRKHSPTMLPTALASILLLGFLGIHNQLTQFDIYSPYQILTMDIQKEYPVLKVNNVYFQRVLNLSNENISHSEDLKHWEQQYAIPYFFKDKPEQVLVVGSGTGNDVATAVRYGAEHIDAVEIDPAIQKLGRLIHPESPYQSPHVKGIVNDARAYIKKTNKKYDLIVYGLLDSHTLLSSMSGVRLDSYVYTVEAFREARSKLADNGIICLTFAIIKPEIGQKLFDMLKEAFDGQSPHVYEIGYDSGYTFIIGNNFNGQTVSLNSSLKEISDKFVNQKLTIDKSTDDWPFFYMPVRKYPISYMVMLTVLLLISLLFIRKLMPGNISREFSWVCFFLGAGFMLIETKGITELALVYGSTWIVISVVIIAILIMAFLANLWVMKYRLPHTFIIYSLLALSILLGYFFYSSYLNNYSPGMGKIIMTGILTLPLLFSGFVFSHELTKTKSVEVALASNLLGAMLGGFLEYNSMYLGYRALYLLALLIYAMAFVSSLRNPQKA